MKDIFYRDISIEKLYIKLNDIDLTYSVENRKDKILHEIKDDKESVVNHVFDVIISEWKDGKEGNSRRIGFGANIDEKTVTRFAEKMIISAMLGMNSSGSALFLPASRTGMLLLYKYFFAEKDNRIYMLNTDDEKNVAKNQLGLSAPVYNFLQFLLKFTPNNFISKKNQEILDFIEDYLIEGRLELSSEESYYVPQNSENMIPLYLSSSLINELAPIVKMLSNVYPYDNIYYDEIETCLHPLKQKAMARLMIRLVNSGRRMIISTHSDSMAINMNNLLTFTLGSLSEEAKLKKMKELGLEEADLLKTEDIYVYQFTNSDHGTSKVSELEYREINNLGYDFELFNKNIQKLSDDTIKIME